MLEQKQLIEDILFEVNRIAIQNSVTAGHEVIVQPKDTEI
jgi:hypothetical protein